MIELPPETEPVNISDNLNLLSVVETETPLDYRSPLYHTPKTMDTSPATAKQHEAYIDHFYQLEKVHIIFCCLY